MILVQSTSDDESTDDVLDWLNYLGSMDIQRINNTISLKETTIRINNETPGITFCSGAKKIDLNTINSYWYRRGKFNVQLPQELETAQFAELSVYLKEEYNHFSSFINKTLREKKHINSFEDQENKLLQLSAASAIGLIIPDTIITGDINALKAFVNVHSRVITKAICSNKFTIPIEEESFYNIAIDTAIFDISTIDGMSEAQSAVFLPALFQQYIEKKYELRIFYLHGAFYPMAIFSQSNEETKIDFRNHTDDHPNRCVPFTLPSQIETTLNSFMNNISLDCGSIDMIVTPSGDYVFLEVNPVGQFQWLSRNCNYNIEKVIAKILINE